MSVKIKLVLVGVLIVMLAGVSYIKTSVSTPGITDDYEKAKIEYFATQDSLHARMLDDSTRHYIDSLIELDRHYTYIIDSINSYYAVETANLTDANKTLEQENKKLTVSQSKTPTAKKKSTTAKKKVKPNPLQSKVKNEYFELAAKLPSDLTSYEKKVAKNEIVIDLADKHKISPDKVKRYIK